MNHYIPQSTGGKPVFALLVHRMFTQAIVLSMFSNLFPFLAGIEKRIESNDFTPATKDLTY